MKPCLVFEARPWAITNETTGKVEREGYTVTYLDPESPHVGRNRGVEALKVTCGKDVLDAHVTSIPCWCHLHFRTRANRETGKAELQLVALRYAGPLEIPEEEAGSMLRRVGPS